MFHKAIQTAKPGPRLGPFPQKMISRFLFHSVATKAFFCTNWFSFKQKGMCHAVNMYMSWISVITLGICIMYSPSLWRGGCRRISSIARSSMQMNCGGQNLKGLHKRIFWSSEFLIAFQEWQQERLQVLSNFELSIPSLRNNQGFLKGELRMNTQHAGLLLDTPTDFQLRLPFQIYAAQWW